MTTANLYEAEFGSPQGLVSMTLTYDTTSLVVQQLIYVNPSSQAGTLTLTGPIQQTITCPANDSRTLDLSSHNIVCVQTQVTNKYTHQPQTITSLPGGESVQFTWPT